MISFRRPPSSLDMFVTSPNCTVKMSPDIAKCSQVQRILHCDSLTNLSISLQNGTLRNYTKNENSARVGQHMPSIPALERERQADLCEFKAILVYRVSSKRARATQKNPVLNETKQENENSSKSNVLFIWLKPMPCKHYRNVLFHFWKEE